MDVRICFPTSGTLKDIGGWDPGGWLEACIAVRGCAVAWQAVNDELKIKRQLSKH